jgi:hypothetical protein
MFSNSMSPSSRRHSDYVMTSSIRSLLALLFCCLLYGCATPYETIPQRATSLEGAWVLNVGESDDAEQMLEDRLEEERAKFRRQMERWQRARGARGEPQLPPIGAEGVDVPAAGREARARVMRRREREERLFRRMLGISQTLHIRHEGNRVEILSAVESRRFDAGSETQVSMPEGQLADSRVGWDGEWFVVSRRARGGPSVVEKFRVLSRTDQLEYYMAWSGETELNGMKVRRIYDRAAGELPPPNPDRGPVR